MASTEQAAALNYAAIAEDVASALARDERNGGRVIAGMEQLFAAMEFALLHSACLKYVNSQPNPAKAAVLVRSRMAKMRLADAEAKKFRDPRVTFITEASIKTANLEAVKVLDNGFALGIKREAVKLDPLAAAMKRLLAAGRAVHAATASENEERENDKRADAIAQVTLAIREGGDEG